MITHTLGDMIMTNFAKLERQHIVNKQIHNFVNTPPEARAGLCTFGVELEFQSDERDEDAIEQEIQDYVNNADPLDYVGDQDLNDTWRNCNEYIIILKLWSGFRGDVEEFFDDHDWFNCSYEDVMERIYDSAREYVEENCACNDSHNVTSQYEVIDDQSVTGGEVRTEGGYQYDDFLEAAGEIISDISDGGGYVDSDCSAHIHVKLGDIHHLYGKRLHRFIMEYLVLNRERLPQAVQNRLYRGGNRWIEPHVANGNDKYQWVHFHCQGTIEFRLFGNIDDVRDIKTCTDLALAALAYAYERRINEGEFELTTDYALELARCGTTEDYGLFDAPGQQYAKPAGPPAIVNIDYWTHERTIIYDADFSPQPDYVPTFLDACIKRRNRQLTEGLTAIGLKRDTWVDLNWEGYNVA
jgi:hypothetical protein